MEDKEDFSDSSSSSEDESVEVIER